MATACCRRMAESTPADWPITAVIMVERITASRISAEVTGWASSSFFARLR